MRFTDSVLYISQTIKNRTKLLYDYVTKQNRRKKADSLCLMVT